MNSRQRRKREAERHNMALAETEAYHEDRLRDPGKYKQIMDKSRGKRLLAILGCGLAMTPYRDGSNLRLDRWE